MQREKAFAHIIAITVAPVRDRPPLSMPSKRDRRSYHTSAITPAPCRRYSSLPAPVLPLRPRRHPKCHVPSQLKQIEITFVSMVHDISNVNVLFLEGLLVNDMRIDNIIKDK
jgi:hypothetical protein